MGGTSFWALKPVQHAKLRLKIEHRLTVWDALDQITSSSFLRLGCDKASRWGQLDPPGVALRLGAITISKYYVPRLISRSATQEAP